MPSEIHKVELSPTQPIQFQMSEEPQLIDQDPQFYRKVNPEEYNDYNYQ